MNEDGKPIEYWHAWRSLAEIYEPVFLEAMDYHEMDLNYPGVDIIERTEPNRSSPVSIE